MLTKGVMRMMETEIGKVLYVQDGRARVEVSPAGHCAQCEMANSCIPGAQGTRVIEVADPVGVSVGQEVHIELSGDKLVLASFLAYIIPLLGLCVGVFIGFAAAGDSQAEFWSGVGGCIGLIVGLLISRMAGQSLKSRGQLTPTIAGIATTNTKQGGNIK